MNADAFTQLASGARSVRVTLDKGTITLRAVPGEAWHLDWRSDDDEAPVVERQDTLLSIRQSGSEGFPTFRRLDVTLTVPSDLNTTTLETAAGTITAVGVSGRSRCESSNGSVTLREATGEAIVVSANGSVTVEGFEGQLDARSGNGSVHVTDVRGGTTLASGNGSVKVRDADGKVRVTTGNGSVDLAYAGGEVEIDSSHGSIHIEAPRDLAVRATTAMGSIRVEGGRVRALHLNSMMGGVTSDAVLAPGAYELETGMGTISVELPPVVRARIEAQTGFGRVKSEFPLVQVGRSGPMSIGGVRMVGSIGAGAPEVELSLRAGKGDIIVRQGADGPVSAHNSGHHHTPERGYERDPQPAFAPADGASTSASPPVASPMLTVLEALARGEITPTEAETLLG